MSAVPVVPPSPANVIACGIVFPIVAGGVVALRFYCRKLQQTQILIDDWLALPAWVGANYCCDQDLRSADKAEVFHDWNVHMPSYRYCYLEIPFQRSQVD